jgi:hypothetical protein
LSSFNLFLLRKARFFLSELSTVFCDTGRQFYSQQLGQVSAV